VGKVFLFFGHVAKRRHCNAIPMSNPQKKRRELGEATRDTLKSRSSVRYRTVPLPAVPGTPPWPRRGYRPRPIGACGVAIRVLSTFESKSPSVALGGTTGAQRRHAWRHVEQGSICNKNVMRAMGLLIPFRMRPMQRRLGLVEAYRQRRLRARARAHAHAR
jgi:hypothetical protein